MESTILIHPVPPLSSSTVSEFISLIKRSSNDQSEGLEWKVDNKYYTAQLQYKCIEGSDQIRLEPALIVLVERTLLPSNGLAAILSPLASANEEFEVSLLVTFSKTQDVEVDEGAWDDLGMDYGMEWIDVASEGLTLGADGIEKEQSGIARVVEALQAHMWDGLIRKAETIKSQTPKMEVEGQSRENDEMKELEKELENLGIPPLPAPKPFQSTTPSFSTTFLPSITSKTNSTPGFEDDFAPFVQPSTSKTFNEDPAFTDYPPPAPRKTTGPPLPSSLDFSSNSHFLLLDDGDDDGIPLEGEEKDDMDEIFAKLRVVREQSKTMGMEERRKLAEEVLLGLL